MADKALIEQLRAQIGAVETDDSFSFSPAASENRSRAHGADADVCSVPTESRAISGGFCEEDASEASERAFSKIVALVNVSDRSEKAIRERLERLEFPADAIADSIDRAKSYGFIDDERFARTLIRSRLSQGKGIPGIGRELRGHEIDIESVTGWPEEFEVDGDSELERALDLLDKRPPRSKNPRDGAYRKLVGKGFASSVASSAARIWADANRG